MLLGEVVTVERRGGTTFVGLDIGWNVNCSYFIYRYAQELVAASGTRSADRTQMVTIAGHINEAGDVFAEDYPFPDVAEGDDGRAAQRRRLPAGDVDDALPAADRDGGLPGSRGEHVSDFEGFVPVAGGRLWAQAAGEGTGVVLAHAGIADARMWDPQWAALAARHRVVRYDLRGFGRADAEATTFSNRADLVAVMDAAGLDRAVLVGCSRAGSIVVDTALEFPDRVSGLVWVCGGLGGVAIDATPEEQAVFAREEALEAAKDWAALADLEVEIWVDGLGQPAGRAPAAVRDLVRRMASRPTSRRSPTGTPCARSAGRRTACGHPGAAARHHRRA